MSHPSETEISLYLSRDLNWWRLLVIPLHLRRCDECRSRLEAYRSDRETVRMFSEHLPPAVNWDRLSAEMMANIRVGIAAGECVTPRERQWSLPVAWRVGIATAGVIVLLIAAWALNMPKGETAALGKAMKAIVQARDWQGQRGLMPEPVGTLVEASSAGVELHENGNRFGVLRQGVRPSSVTVNMQGSARARYIDSDTGQVTITSVYAE